MDPKFRLMSYNPTWQQEYEQTKSGLLSATQGWLTDVAHIGSTAIIDGIARPVIDVLAGMQDLQGLNEVSELIEGLNFNRVESPAWCEDELCAFLQKPRKAEPTHTVLVVKYEGRIWKSALAVRQHLSDNLMAWQALQSLKQDHFHAGCSALAEYTQAKQSFFEKIDSSE